MGVSAALLPSHETVRGLRVVRIGLLGAGTVGQAVARAAAAAAPRLRARGVALSIECTLVRDVAKPRQAPRFTRLTTNPEAFLRGRYDVVIDALPGREPAATIVGRLLGKGTPVVSANKAMVAAEGRRLRRIAARGGTTLRIEATALAGVPFIGAFERRPLAADAERFTAIVNGTSNFILTRIADGLTFDAALAEAQTFGYAEPDPSDDISGQDSLRKLIILGDLLLGVEIRPERVTVEGIEALTPAALVDARARDEVIKPIVFAERQGAHVTAHVAPRVLPASHPLAGVTGRNNGILIESRNSGPLLFTGAGAGPDVTAATLLDDAIEVVHG